MRISLLKLLGSIVFAVALVAGEVGAIELTAQPDRQGYSIGYQLGVDFRDKKIQVNPETLAAGIKAAMEGSEPAIPAEQMHAVLTELQSQVDQERKAGLKKIADDNRLAGEKFLIENGTKEGVTTLPSGLQYKVVKAGDGPTPGPEAKVTVNYRGTLPDGTEFDSSYKRGKPVTLPIRNFVPGWVEALHLMPVGSKWILYLPSNLGYGEMGRSPVIGPNQVLVFELELLAVE